MVSACWEFLFFATNLPANLYLLALLNKLHNLQKVHPNSIDWNMQQFYFLTDITATI
jgi:hypothetical protein